MLGLDLQVDPRAALVRRIQQTLDPCDNSGGGIRRVIPSEDVASRLPVSRPVVVWRCGSQMRRHSRWVESTTAFRVLKKTLEAPYTTKVNYRGQTSRGITPQTDAQTDRQTPTDKSRELSHSILTLR